MTNIRMALDCAADALVQAGVPDPRTDAELLLSFITGLPRLELRLQGTRELNPEQEQRLSSLLLSRASRQPLQYLLGEQYFYGRPFFVDERVLIPRPETETLCEIVLSYLQGLPAPRALDVCTGSGAIAITLAKECPGAQLTATDISEPALAVARENAAQNHASVRFCQGDLFAPVKGERFDCIVSNPPYIESAACVALQAEVLREPLLALDGGDDGLAFYRRIASEAADFLSPGGLLALETGDTQTKAVAALLQQEARYTAITIHPDLSGSPRVVCALSFPT